MTLSVRNKLPNAFEALDVNAQLKRNHPDLYRSSDRSTAHERRWPAGMDPVQNRTPVFARNEIELKQPPEKVFAALAQANNWSSYYFNAKDVSLPGGASKLEDGMRFTWSTFGTQQKTTVKEFEPGKALAWLAESPGTKAYHRWILEKTPSGGTRLITEETQTGPMASVIKGKMNPALHASHELWLRGLKEQLDADSGGGRSNWRR